MREIKFRAWDTKRRAWCPTGRENGFVIFADGCVAFPEGGWDIEGPIAKPEEQNIILMQWTGARDRNGHEVYEGDVAKQRENLAALSEGEPITTGDIVGPIVWDNQYACYTIRAPDPRGVLPDTDYFIRSGEVEVIGNIYENPELLIR